MPIVCGGTFLWVRALIYGLAEAPRGDEELRARHRELGGAGRPSRRCTRGWREVDPASAARLAPNDFVRVSRALEVFELTGKPLSEVQAAHGFREPRFAARLVGVARERPEQDELIAARVRGMLAAGWVREVEAPDGGGVWRRARHGARSATGRSARRMAAGTVARRSRAGRRDRARHASVCAAAAHLAARSAGGVAAGGRHEAAVIRAGLRGFRPARCG